MKRIICALRGHRVLTFDTPTHEWLMCDRCGEVREATESLAW